MKSWAVPKGPSLDPSVKRLAVKGGGPPAGRIVREQALRTPPAKAASVGDARSSHAVSGQLHVTDPKWVIDTLTGTTKLDRVRHDGLVGDLMMTHLKGRQFVAAVRPWRRRRPVGKGLHVVVPLRRLHDWGAVNGYSRAIVAHIAQPAQRARCHHAVRMVGAGAAGPGHFRPGGLGRLAVAARGATMGHAPSAA